MKKYILCPLLSDKIYRTYFTREGGKGGGGNYTSPVLYITVKNTRPKRVFTIFVYNFFAIVAEGIQRCCKPYIVLVCLLAISGG